MVRVYSVPANTFESDDDEDDDDEEDEEEEEGGQDQYEAKN